MLREFKRLILLTSIAAALAADKDRARFEPLPAGQYPHHQTTSGITVAASVVETDDEARPAFGKSNPYKAGVMPVLVVIQNSGKAPINAERIKVDYLGPDRSRLESTPAAELRFLHGTKQPKVISSPIPGVGVKVGKSKQALSGWEIEGRAFAAKMILPGESASGFFYFQTGKRGGSTLYLSGLRDAASGQDLLYFEIPL